MCWRYKFEVYNGIEGAASLIEWFGYWPSFHDAEILSLELNRDRPTKLKIYTWEISNQLDSDGRYVLVKHVVVTFSPEGITDLNLKGFSRQNAIAGLSLKPVDEGYELTLDECYGLHGRLVAARAKLEIEPGLPDPTFDFHK